MPLRPTAPTPVRAALTILLTMLALIVATPPAHPAAPAGLSGGLPVAPPRTQLLGVGYHPLWSDSYPDAASRAAALDTFATAGANAVRMDVSWTQLEKSGNDSYDKAALAALDQRIKEVTDRKMTMVAMVWAAPKWVTGVEDPDWPGFGLPGAALTTPAAAAAYGDFLAFLAARYPTVAAWEMWNEPDERVFWNDAINPTKTDTLPERAASYAAATVHAYDVAHAKAPRATFLLAGPAGLGLADGWFDALYAARTVDGSGRSTGVAGHYDGVATHPYCNHPTLTPPRLGPMTTGRPPG